MTLVADVTLTKGTYAAAGMHPERPEKVPSPYRLFCALVASAAKTGDPRNNPALQWLEQQDPPTLIVPPVLDEGVNHSFVVTNKRARSGSTTHPARTNNARRRAWVNFKGDGFQMAWDAKPNGPTLAELQRIARSVTYLGRVESHARVRFSTHDGLDPRDATWTWEPAELSEAGRNLGVPYTGSLSALTDAHDRGAPSWTTIRQIRYRQHHEAGKSPILGPFGSLVTFTVPGVPLGSESLLDATVGLRAAVMSRVAHVVGEDNIPEVVHGHVRDITHVAFLALPFVAHDHADGGIRGLALAIPRDMPDHDRAVLGQALTPGPPSSDSAVDGLTRVSLPRYGRADMAVRYEPWPTSPWTIQSDRWSGGTNGATHWTTATPMMLGKFPKHDGDTDRFVAEACVQAGYPAPIAVHTSTSPLIPGAAVWHRHYRGLIGHRPRRPTLHVTIEFPEPVVGPVLIGSLRYMGLGLCVPQANQAPESAMGQTTERTGSGGPT